MQRFDGVTDKPTPHLDAVQNKVNKLLKATAASYIPEACEALRKDWNPTMPDAIFRQSENLALQKQYRQKILETFAVEYNPTDGVWAEHYIQMYWPKWLTNPKQEEVAQKMQSAKEAKKVSNFIHFAQEQTKSLDKIAAKLPEPPKIEASEPVFVEQQEETETQIEGTDEAEQKQFTIQRMDGELKSAEHSLWCALTGERNLPNSRDDLINDHIKPTRQFRNNLFYELESMGTLGTVSTNGHYKRLTQLRTLIDEALEIIETMSDKR